VEAVVGRQIRSFVVQEVVPVVVVDTGIEGQAGGFLAFGIVFLSGLEILLVGPTFVMCGTERELKIGVKSHISAC
jgi:hypothetical protein